MEYDEFYQTIRYCFEDVAAIHVDADSASANLYHVKVQADRIGKTVLDTIRNKGLVIVGISTGQTPSGLRFIKLAFDNKSPPPNKIE